VPAAEFFLGYRTVDMKPDEILLKVRYAKREVWPGGVLLWPMCNYEVAVLRIE
jgi:hypothetical protein